MLSMLLAQLLDGFFNVFYTARFTHCLGAVVAMAASTIPITCQGFGMESDLDTPLLGYANEKITGHPEMVTHGNAFAWANLEFPLSWHHLCIDATDVDTGVKTSTVVSFDEITGKNLSGTYLGLRSEPWMIKLETNLHHNSKALGDRGNHPLAIHKDSRQHLTECTPVQDRTTELHLWLAP